jgi:hypothetical protein
MRHALTNARDEMACRREGRFMRSAANIGVSLFNRFCAWRQMHPMSGGIHRVRRGDAREFLELRERTFGFELAPLPRSLQLPVVETQRHHALAHQ